MGAIVAIGEQEQIRGLALAGVRTVAAESTSQVRQAWAQLPADVEVVIVSAAAAAALADRSPRPGPLLVVMQ